MPEMLAFGEHVDALCRVRKWTRLKLTWEYQPTPVFLWRKRGGPVVALISYPDGF